MTDYRTFFDKDYIGAWSLPEGKDVTVTITKVVGGQLTGVGGRKTRKPVIYMKGTEKGLALNATNSKTIAGMYGNHVEEWAGKRVTLFKSTTTFGSEQMECVRIRPRIPGAKNEDGALNSEPPPPPPDKLGDEEPTTQGEGSATADAPEPKPHEGTAKMLLHKIGEVLSARSLDAVIGDYAEEIEQMTREAPELHKQVQDAIAARRAGFKK